MARPSDTSLVVTILTCRFTVAEYLFHSEITLSKVALLSRFSNLSRNSDRSCFLGTSLPRIFFSEVAMGSLTVGSLLTLIPRPIFIKVIISASASISESNPEIFLPFTRISLGHFTTASILNISRKVRVRIIDAAKLTLELNTGDICGRSIIVK